jgi:hypothetical protein
MKKGNFSWIIITLFRNCKYLNNKWNTDYRVGDTFRDCGLSEDRTYQWWHGVNHLTFSWSYPFSAWDFSRAFKIRLFFLVIIRFCKKESIYIYFSYIVVVSFTGGGNQRIRRKLPICRKSLTNFITSCCIEYTSPLTGLELTTLVIIGTDCPEKISRTVY